CVSRFVSVTDLASGAYEHIVTNELARRLAAVSADLVQRGPLDPVDAHELLARYAAAITRRALGAIPGDGSQRLSAQVAVVNRRVPQLADTKDSGVNEDARLSESPALLWAIASRPPAPQAVTFPQRPRTGFASGALLVNGPHQPRFGHE